jgi:hypothetical protein
MNLLKSLKTLLEVFAMIMTFTTLTYYTIGVFTIAKTLRAQGDFIIVKTFKAQQLWVVQTRGEGCRATITSNNNARSVDVNQKLKCVWELDANEGVMNIQPSVLPLFNPTHHISGF